MHKRFLIVAIALLMAFGGVNIQHDNDVTMAQDGDPIKVGAIFDLTGPTSDVGSLYAEGVRGYIDWLNENGGINGRPVELLSEDYAYNVETAENLYVRFVNDGAVVFQGWGTGDTEALRGRVAEDQIPFMSASYSVTLGDPEEAPYNFLVGTTYSDQLVIMMQHMIAEWEAEGYDREEIKFAFFHHDSPFGTSPLPDGEAYAEELGIETLRVAMPRGATSFEGEITSAVNEFGATHIVVQNVSTGAALLLNNLDDLGLLEFVEFGCLNWCGDELLIEATGDASEGIYGALPFAPTTVELPGQEEAIEWLGGRDALVDATLHYTQGWWTMAVMTEGIRLTLDNGEELNGPNIKANLESLENFDTGGITAPITFSAEDHRGNRALTIYTVEDGVWVESSEQIDLSGMDMDDMEDMEDMAEESE